MFESEPASCASEDIMFCVSHQSIRKYQAIPHRFTPVNWWVSLLGVSTVVVLIALMISRSYIAHHALNLDEAERVSGCEAMMLHAIKPQPETINLAVLGSVRSLCYQDVAGEDVLTDFGIRKSAYLNQQIQTTILMWMVVAITLSGVFLAALQLIAGYQLALTGKAAFEQGQGGQLTVEHSKISLSSSVTGLMILTISLAFFMVFVSKVYLIQETHAQVDAPVRDAGFPATIDQGAQASTARSTLSAVLQPRPGEPAAVKQNSKTSPGPTAMSQSSGFVSESGSEMVRQSDPAQNHAHSSALGNLNPQH
ncbi:MAG: hypothetical protein ABSC65_11225 [Acidobacteriaceae bacterium]|jgi:hypothetical protein